MKHGRSSLLPALLDFERSPGRHRVVLREPRPLFEHIGSVMRLAAGRPVPGLPVAPASAPGLRRAARFFVRTVMLRPGSDALTLLGLSPGFEPAQLRAHYRLMIRLTHPDFDPAGEDWPADAATRVNLANDLLSSPQKRAPHAAAWQHPPAVVAPATMIDLHCHILPGIDDGAKTLDDSLAMARIAVADGIHTLACTPHIYPGMYMNDGPGIAQACGRLQAALDHHGIALKLVVGADVHLVPGLIDGLRSGRVPTLNGSRYFLLEPSHTTPPPRLEAAVFDLIVAGYTPIITHPERLTWVESHYPVFQRLIAQGAWMQVTAGALTGVFGPRARYWGERFIGEGHTHLLATDAHSTGRRRPRLSEGLEVARRLVGDREARRLVIERPTAVLKDLPPQGFGLSHTAAAQETDRPSMIRRWLSKRRATP